TIVMTTGITVYNHAISVTPPTSKNANNGDSSWTSEATYYALTNLNDPFSLSVTTASSFPAGTTYSWTIMDSNNHTKDKSGSSASVKPNEVGTIGTTTSSMMQWTVSCTAALPSGLTSTKTHSFYVYKLTIPSIDIVIESAPYDLRLEAYTPNKYFVGSDDKSKTFKFTAEHSGVMPTGVEYKWYVGTRQIGSGISITPSIQTLRNTTSVPTSNETCTVRCEVSLTGCDTKSGSTSITFAKPKTFTGDGITFGETSNSFYQYTTGGGTTWTVAYPSTWEQNLTYGVTNGTLPSGCSITWHFSYIVEELGINVVKDEEGPTFNIKPKEFYGNANFDESTNNGIWYVYYTISAPGYKTVANGSIYVCIQKKAEGWTYTDP
ncbi:MAG: hypothetical protein J5817_01140, partial [Treponema sp.]|nr:hypothetical protein [Treponema sp.]